MFFIRLLSRLPLRLLYVLSDFLFLATYYIAGYRRKLVRRNLRNSFPSKSASELKAIERQFYKNLCDYAVEMLKLVTISRAELASRMAFEDPGIPQRFKEQHQSIIFLASHQFNWEWLLVSASITFPMPIEFVYQPVKSRFFDKLSLETRSRFGAYPIRRDEVAREVVKRKNKLRGIATVADQYPGYGHDKKHVTTFLNQETAFFYGTHQLAALTQYPAIYYEITKIRRGYYSAKPVVAAVPPYDRNNPTVIESYVRLVEGVIHRDPAGWLWSHNRWKNRHINM